MDTTPACGYLSRVVDLPVAIAEVLFDDVTRSLGPADRRDPATISTVLLPARRIRTRLPAPIPFPSVPVEIELAPWSRSRSEVAVRYAGKGRPRAVARRVYEAAVPHLLDGVTAAINARLPGRSARRRAA